ncbi:MAG: hypothetical protein ACI8XO_004957 [Verrucomicrobiales bacterium]|jgi:hypothetical protein
MAKAFDLRRGPRNSRPAWTARGGTFLGASLVCLIVGTLFGERAGVHLGIFGLLVLGIAWAAAYFNLVGLEFHRELPAHAFAQEDFSVRLKVTNSKRRLDSFAINVEDSMLPFSNRGLSATWVRSLGSSELSFSTRVPRRGVVNRSSLVVESTFPFGLFRTGRKISVPISLTIFPKPVIPRALEEAEDSDMLEGMSRGTPTRDPSGDFRAIREFQSGDPMKAVHWHATARAGKVMVREFDRPVPESYAVIFHSYCPPGYLLAPDSFELSMELLAGLLIKCEETSIPLILAANFTAWQMREIGGQADLNESLRILAVARHQPESDLSGVQAALDALPHGSAAYVLSDTPIVHWSQLMPNYSFPVTCLDNSDIRVQRPIFKTR